MRRSLERDANHDVEPDDQDMEDESVDDVSRERESTISALQKYSAAAKVVDVAPGQPLRYDAQPAYLHDRPRVGGKDVPDHPHVISPADVRQACQ